ncbi:MAG: hypothetical protein VB118_07395 [Oscillospiraceae bacterium]|nr:hypothetical protein [Oscillospiraceae bacterium]
MKKLDRKIINDSSNIKKMKEYFLWRYLAVAACVCLIIVVSVITIQKILNRSSESQKTKEFFTIENGVLLSYTGTDTNVVIPDTVTAISADALKFSPSAALITTVTLGKSVKTIDEQAFMGLNALKAINVPKGNNCFDFSDGILASIDGSLYISTVATQSDSDAFSAFLGKIQSGVTSNIKFSHFVIDNAILTMHFDEPSYDPNLFITSLTAFGHTITFSDPTAIYGNFTIQAFQAQNCFVFSKLSNSVGNTWIFRTDGVYSFDNTSNYTLDYAYNDSIVTFFLNDDRTLGYKRTLRKYLQSQAVGGEIEFCTGRDEFCCEYGSVSWNEASPIYIPQSSYTVSDVFDLNELFDKWHQTVNLKIDTLDEFLTFNAKKYKKGN